MRRVLWLLVCVTIGALAGLASERASAAPAQWAAAPQQVCSVEGAGSLPGERSFRLAAAFRNRGLEGGLKFSDMRAGVVFEGTAVTGLFVADGVASIQGRGKTRTGTRLSFIASVDRAKGTFALWLSDGYTTAGDLGRSSEVALTGSCPFDGDSTPVLDAPRRVSAAIGRAGGTVASGGLTLTVPAGALSEETTIALTPLLDLADSPLAGSLVGGAKLEPEGLRFLRPAVLTFDLPAGISAAQLVGFGSAGDGSELHLQPHTVSAGKLSLQLWHFSTAGGSSGGSSAAASLQTRTISNAERQALQRVAAAHQACNAEVAQGIFAGPACADVRPESVRALFDWYSSAVRPGLDQAAAALSFEAEEALAEWLAWNAEVLSVFQNDPAGTPRCGTLENECIQAHGLATAAVAAHAQRRLENCTGTSLVAQLRDVARMADYAAVGTIDLTGLELPDAANGSLLRACASIRIDPPTFPAVAARVKPNRLSVRAYIATYTDAQLSEPLQLTLALTNAGVDASSALLDPNDGRFATNVYPLEGAIGVVVDITVELAASALPQLTDALLRENFTTTHEVVSPARERLLLVAQGPTTVPAGGTLDLLVLVAGDGMTDDVTLTVGGPGSVGPTPVTPNAQGAASATYTAPSSTVNPDAQVIATLSDGTSATVPITIAAVVTVSLSPTSASLTAGGTQNFTATVANSLLGVTWSATGGDIVTTGSTTARYEARSTPGTFSVTATSISDPTKSATATITITGATSAGRVRVQFRTAQASVSAQLDDAGGIHDNKNFAEEPPLAFGAVSHLAELTGATASHFSRLLGTSSTLDAAGNMSFSASADFTSASSSFSVGFHVENAPLRYVLEATTTHSGNPNCSTDIILQNAETGALVVNSGTSPTTASRSGTLSPGTYQFVVGGGCRNSGSGGASFDFSVEP